MKYVGIRLIKSPKRLRICRVVQIAYVLTQKLIVFSLKLMEDNIQSFETQLSKAKERNAAGCGICTHFKHPIIVQFWLTEIGPFYILNCT